MGMRRRRALLPGQRADGRARALRTMVLLTLATLSLVALATPFLSSSGAAESDPPLRMWVITDDGQTNIQSREYYGWIPGTVTSLHPDPVAWAGSGPLGVTVVVENLADLPIVSASVTVEGAAACTRTFAVIRPGSGGRRAFRCELPAELARVVTVTNASGPDHGHAYDPSWPSEAIRYTTTSFLTSFSAIGRLGSDQVSDDFRLNVSDYQPGPMLAYDALTVEAASLPSPTSGQAAATVVVTNQSSLLRYLGSLDASASGLISPSKWSPKVVATCTELPATLPPGASTTANCEWARVPWIESWFQVTVRGPDGGHVTWPGLLDYSVKIPPEPGPLRLEVTPAVNELAPGTPAEIDVTLTNSGAVPVESISMQTADAAGRLSPFDTCTAGLGTQPLAAGERRTWSCTSTGWEYNESYSFQAHGTASGAPVGAVASTVVRIQTEQVPPAFSYSWDRSRARVPVGQTAELVLNVELPPIDPGFGLVFVSVDDPARPECDGGWSNMPNGSQTTEPDFRCRITVGPGMNGVAWEPTVTFTEMKHSGFTILESRMSTATTSASVGSGSEANLSFELTPTRLELDAGGSTSVQVTVRNLSGAPMSDVSTWLQAESDDKWWYSNSFGERTCDRSFTSLPAGGSITYSCALSTGFGGFGGVETMDLRAFVGATDGDLLPAASMAVAQLDYDSRDLLRLELIGPDSPVSDGATVQFTVRIINDGGASPTDWVPLSIWSAELPDCNRSAHESGREVPPPGPGRSVAEYTCSAAVGEQINDGELLTLNAAVLPFEEGGQISRVFGAATKVDVASGVTPPTAPTNPPAPTTTVPTTSVPTTTVQPSVTVPDTSAPIRLSPDGPVSPSSQRTPRSAGMVVLTPESGDESDPGPSASRDTGSGASQLRSIDPAPSTQVEGRTEAALSAPEGVPSEVAAPTSDSRQPPTVLEVQRVRARGVVSSSQPATSLSLVLVIAIVAALVVRPLVSRSGRSRVSSVPTEPVGPSSGSEELV